MKPNLKQLLVLVVVIAAGLGLTYLAPEDGGDDSASTSTDTVAEQAASTTARSSGLHVVIAAPGVDARTLAAEYRIPYREPSRHAAGGTVFTTRVPDSLMSALQADERVQTVSRTTGGGVGEIEY